MFIRLQHENKMLRLQQEGTENQRIEELQEQLEQKHRKMNELETEQRWHASSQWTSHGDLITSHKIMVHRSGK